MQIKFNNIHYQYPETDTIVFENLTCRLTGPGFHGLFGPSGVGKTTLANMIAGNMPPEADGFSGEIVTRQLPRTLYSYNLERLPGWSCINDHLLEITPPANHHKIDDLVHSFGLQSCLNSRFSQLSLGQQTRSNLARYLLQDFDLLIMDESLGNVDEVTRGNIICKIKELFPEKCFLYISHNAMEVSQFCCQIMVLRTPLKTPQALVVSGLDSVTANSLQEKALASTMLEILRAS